MPQSEKKHKQAFTLVELIITITIIAILATIGFVSFQTYFGLSRDSVRVSDIKTIYNGLSIHKVKSGNVLLPESHMNIYGGTVLLRIQGEVSKNIKRIINVNGNAFDPQTERNYIYVTDYNQNKFQLMGYLEKGENVRYISLISQTQAKETTDPTYKNKVLYVYGDKLGIITDENKVPIQYTGTIPYEGESSLSLNILDIQAQENKMITYFGGDVGVGGKTTATGNSLMLLMDASLSGSLSCSSKTYQGYDIPALSHNETTSVTKLVNISNGNQIYELTIQCINGDLSIQNATENIINTNCTTDGYIPHNNECVLNQCQNNIPINTISTATSQNFLANWMYSLTPGECSFVCQKNYTYNTVNQKCEATTRMQACSNIPNNAIYNSQNSIPQTWNGMNWLPNSTSTYNIEPTTTECRFVCELGYSYDSVNNLCVGNSCSIPSSDTYDGKTYVIVSPNTLSHGNTTTKEGNYVFGTSPSSGTLSASFEYTCHAGVLTKVSSLNLSGSCSAGYIFNNNYSSPLCNQIINGVCGTANQKSRVNIPSANLCSSGNATSVTTSPTTYTWSCNGINSGSTVNCSTYVLTLPVENTPSNITTSQINWRWTTGNGLATKYEWSTNGTTWVNETTNLNHIEIGLSCGTLYSSRRVRACDDLGFCTSVKTLGSVSTTACPVNGVCNNSTRGGCTAGTISRINNTASCGTTATWNCLGSNGGSNSSTCSFNNGLCPVNGVCGSANGVGTYPSPSTNLCSSGISTVVSGTKTYTWSCTGQNGGSTANCSASCYNVGTWQSRSTTGSYNCTDFYASTACSESGLDACGTQYYTYKQSCTQNGSIFTYVCGRRTTP